MFNITQDCYDNIKCMSICPLGTTKYETQCLGQSLVVRCLFTNERSSADSCASKELWQKRKQQEFLVILLISQIPNYI